MSSHYNIHKQITESIMIEEVINFFNLKLKHDLKLIKTYKITNATSYIIKCNICYTEIEVVIYNFISSDLTSIGIIEDKEDYWIYINHSNNECIYNCLNNKKLNFIHCYDRVISNIM